ncbi:MAG: discoidin domain-containing protein, partial [Burkholderiales bacterium]|nr:discoidin domain-containing protein [Phycisphaerae bacterium]
NGQTGANMATVPFVVARGSVSSWGDGYGNRVDRFLGGVAYLDGVRPSLIMGRGYYARTTISAWDWRNGQFTQRWVFDTGTSTTGPLSSYRGQGTHSLSVQDVDGDGKDEIIYGASTIDDNGTARSTSGLGHGDALHASDMDPSRLGVEVYQVHEGTGSNGHFGASVRDGATSQLLVALPVTQYTDSTGALKWPDVGRGLAIDLDPRSLGYEFWNSTHPDTYGITGNVVAANVKPSSTNFAVWWDGDPLRELLNGTTIDKWNSSNNTTGRVLTGYQVAPVSSINGTKATPNLSADLLGDWREEVILRASDNTALYIFATTTTATTRMTTLMHDTQYRVAIAWQNGAYNQPPHPSYLIGDSMPTPPRRAFYLAGAVSAPTGLTATPLSSSQVRLNWADVNTQETGFQIDRATDGVNFTQIGTVAANILTFTDSGRLGGTLYQYRVRATGPGAPSDYSNTAVVTTFAATGSLSGVVFNDANGSAIREGGEAGVSGRIVYIDKNNNSSLDAGDASATTDSAGAYGFSGLSVGTYVVRQVLPGGWVQTSPANGAGRTLSIAEAQTVVGQDFGTRQPAVVQSDVALRKPVRASSQQSSSYEPAKVTDGSSASRWASSNSDNQWIEVDLGQPMNISAVQLKWYSFYGRGYSIQVSPDDVAWTTVFSTTTGDGGTDSITNLSATGRYVRMQGTQRSSTGGGYSLWDFNVYGTPVTPAPSTGSISGLIFWDSDADGTRDSSEVGQAAKLVFIDGNGDDILQSTEWNVLTDSVGAYSFKGLSAGSYHIRRVVPNGYMVTTPDVDVELSAGVTVSGVLIGTSYA